MKNGRMKKQKGRLKNKWNDAWTCSHPCQRDCYNYTHTCTHTRRLQPFPLTFIHHCGVNRICSSVLHTDEGLNDVSLWLLPENNRDLKSFPNISNPFLTDIQTKYQMTSDQAVCLWWAASLQQSIKVLTHYHHKSTITLTQEQKTVDPTWPPVLI